MGKKIFMDKERLFTGKLKLGIDETNYKVSSLEHNAVCCRDVALTQADTSRLETSER